MSTQLGSRIKELRSQQNLLQRQVAAQLDMDTPLYSKIERGERIASKQQISQLARILHTPADELLTIWLADKVYELVKEEHVADQALKSVSKKIKKTK